MEDKTGDTKLIEIPLDKSEEVPAKTHSPVQAAAIGTHVDINKEPPSEVDISFLPSAITKEIGGEERHYKWKRKDGGEIRDHILSTSEFLKDIIDYLKLHEPKKEPLRKMSVTDRRSVRMPRSCQSYLASTEEDRSTRSSETRRINKEKKPRREIYNEITAIKQPMQDTLIQIVKTMNGFSESEADAVLEFVRNMSPKPKEDQVLI
ncbi:hypothetical protein EIN_429050 [Entamoeba invadens IP1]|uniref:Uncharacterized protein n=1 Tax=Entamoeba invadens IP1 TaxID=370355 RepID=A0A0A1UGU2_ENTIV|nr:hypothetical protein EIN_429050 [Entamoeba invadens IP1]ELP95159.1 hypothetical protein EIN_429050 [Entamoeba invadens IP1]|eukprot:XP_004261930.1 hypothetical protein EIN_429050 [Entamoeba invadens IP1]